jgi:hypothetical protein
MQMWRDKIRKYRRASLTITSMTCFYPHGPFLMVVLIFSDPLLDPFFVQKKKSDPDDHSTTFLMDKHDKIEVQCF